VSHGMFEKSAKCFLNKSAAYCNYVTKLVVNDNSVALRKTLS